MKDFLIEDFFDFDKIWPKWLNLLLNLLANVPTLINSIKEKCYDRLRLLYKPNILIEQLVDLLDKYDYFPDDTIPEIIMLIKNQYVIPLSCFKNRLCNKKFKISREKSQSYIDEIILATLDLEPRTNQSHNTIIQYTNEIKELLNKIE